MFLILYYIFDRMNQINSFAILVASLARRVVFLAVFLSSLLPARRCCVVRAQISLLSLFTELEALYEAQLTFHLFLEPRGSVQKTGSS